MHYEPGSQVMVPQGTPLYPWPSVPPIRRDHYVLARVLGKSQNDNRMIRILWRNVEYEVFASEVRTTS